MANKTLGELLSRYNPDGIQRDIITSASAYKCRVDKQHKLMELTVDLPRIYFKQDIRSLEDEIKKAYELNYVHVITHYGRDLFRDDCVDEMLQELQYRGAVAKGFFYDYDYTVDNTNKTIDIKIGFIISFMAYFIPLGH